MRFLRQRLQRAGACLAQELTPDLNGQIVHTAGLVRFRQRPQTAAGILFMTLEDESGIINLIVHAKTLQAQHRVLLESSVMWASGHLQHQDGTTHLILGKARNIDDWLQNLPSQSRDFR